MMAKTSEIQETARIDTLFERISVLIEQAHQQVATAVNKAEVYTKYSIGKYIVEDEQQGKARAWQTDAESIVSTTNLKVWGGLVCRNAQTVQTLFRHLLKFGKHCLSDSR